MIFFNNDKLVLQVGRRAEAFTEAQDAMRELVVQRNQEGTLAEDENEEPEENTNALSLQPGNCGSLSGECSSQASNINSLASDQSNNDCYKSECANDEIHTDNNANGTLLCNTRL